MAEASAKGKVQELEAEALQALIAGGEPVLVDIWARWCGPCKGMMPIVDEIAGEWADRLTVVKLEIDNSAAPQNDGWTRQFEVRSVPTFILFDGGTDIAGFAGTATRVQLNDWLTEKLGAQA